MFIYFPIAGSNNKFLLNPKYLVRTAASGSEIRIYLQTTNVNVTVNVWNQILKILNNISKQDENEINKFWNPQTDIYVNIDLISGIEITKINLRIYTIQSTTLNISVIPFDSLRNILHPNSIYTIE